MDATGIDLQILSLTAPGVQIFDAALAVGLARSANDELAEAIAKHPTRYTGLAAIAPQNPAAAAKELERAVQKLGLKGAIVNSHTHGEYLDNEKFWDIFAAAEALDVPIYIHPNTPPNSWIEPFMERGLDGAVFGFAVETGLHALRLVVSGAFDRFPKLRVVLGHLGEGLPYWLFRIDFMHGASVRSNRYASQPKLERKASEYLRENFYYTTSGMAWTPPIRYVQEVMGMDRLMYAMDYPYQFVPEEVNSRTCWIARQSLARSRPHGGVSPPEPRGIPERGARPAGHRRRRQQPAAVRRGELRVRQHRRRPEDVADARGQLR